MQNSTIRTVVKEIIIVGSTFIASKSIAHYVRVRVVLSFRVTRGIGGGRDLSDRYRTIGLSDFVYQLIV